MADVDLEVWCERLSGEVRTGIRAGRSKKWRCPAGVRSRIVAYAEVGRGRGVTILITRVRAAPRGATSVLIPMGG